MNFLIIKHTYYDGKLNPSFYFTIKREVKIWGFTFWKSFFTIFSYGYGEVTKFKTLEEAERFVSEFIKHKCKILPNSLVKKHIKTIGI